MYLLHLAPTGHAVQSGLVCMYVKLFGFDLVEFP